MSLAAARDIENEKVYATLTAESRDIIPEATYSTFLNQDNGHYSIKVFVKVSILDCIIIKFIQLLKSVDDLDNEEQLLSASVLPNSEAEQTEPSSSQEEKVILALRPINVNRVSVSFLNMQKDYFVPKFNSYDDTMVSYNSYS